MLDKAWFGSIIGILGAIIGIVSITLYLLSLRKPLLAYYVKGLSLVQNNINIDNFEILVNKKKVNKIVKTSIFIWNKGNRVIRKNDIAEKNKLSIIWGHNTSIYQINLGKISNPFSSVNLQPNIEAKTILIDFDFLNKSDGFRVDIYHNFDSSIFEFNGTVIGNKKSIKKIACNQFNTLTQYRKTNIFRNISLVFFSVISAFYLYMGLFLPESYYVNNNYSETTKITLKTIYILFSILFIGFIPFFSILFRKNYPSTLDE
jgi:hypothetical protein